MNGFYGECLRLEIFGQSHAASIGMTLEGVYRHSMYIKGEFKNIVVYHVTKEQFYAALERNA